MNKHWTKEEKLLLTSYIMRKGVKDGIDAFAEQSPRTGTGAYKKYRDMVLSGEWLELSGKFILEDNSEEGGFWKKIKNFFKKLFK